MTYHERLAKAKTAAAARRRTVDGLLNGLRRISDPMADVILDTVELEYMSGWIDGVASEAKEHAETLERIAGAVDRQSPDATVVA